MEELIQRVGMPMFVLIIIESWNELILVILISIMLIGRTLDKSNSLIRNLEIPLSTELSCFFIAVLLYDLFDIIGHSFLNTDSAFAFYAVRISIFMYFLVGELQTVLLLHVLKRYIVNRTGGKLLNGITMFFMYLQMINILALFINPFYSNLYYIDESNMYHRLWGSYFIWQSVTICTIIFIIIVFMVKWKKIDVFIRRIFVIATVFPIAALVGSLFISGISLNNIMVIISALLMFILYEKNKTDIGLKSIYELESAQIQLMEKQLVIEQNKHELQENKIKLLVAQIQPHFIFNSLMALQSKSTDNPELYEGIKSFGKYLRASFEAMTENTLIPFNEELKNIKAYISLESINYGDKLRVEYDIEIDNFMVPALSIEPLVENAIRYGVGTYEEGGLVRISVHDEPDCILIEVWDDGSGGNKLTDAQKGRKSIGISNVDLRLKAMDMGDLSITQDEKGTSAVIRLKYEENKNENNNDR